MAWLLTLLLLALVPLAAHVRYTWRGEEREWQGPFYEDEWPDEEPGSTSPIYTLGKLFYYGAVLACLGLLVYFLTEARRQGIE